MKQGESLTKIKILKGIIDYNNDDSNASGSKCNSDNELNL